MEGTNTKRKKAPIESRDSPVVIERTPLFTWGQDKKTEHENTKDESPKSEKGSPSDLELINNFTVEPLKEEDIFTFKIELCDNDADRVGDKMTDHFLEQVASRISGVTGLTDHSWESDNQMARMYKAEVANCDGEITKTGETRKVVLGSAYTLRKFSDFIDKINSGLLREVSIGFKSKNDKCSICGAPTKKDIETDIATCANGHRALGVYEGVTCYNVIDELEDIMEWSVVAVPCQAKAHIRKGLYGDKTMKRKDLMLRRIMASKAYKEATKEEQETLEKGMAESGEEDVTIDDMEKIITENEELKEQVKALTQELTDMKAERAKAQMENIVSKSVDDLKPLTPKVKEMFMKELPWDEFEVGEDGTIPGLEEAIKKALPGYDGLFVTQSETEAIGGHAEPDGDEAGFLIQNENPTPTGELPDGDEGKIMEVGKGYNKPTGISLKSSSKGTGTTTSKGYCPVGIYFK